MGTTQLNCHSVSLRLSVASGRGSLRANGCWRCPTHQHPPADVAGFFWRKKKIPPQQISTLACWQGIGICHSGNVGWRGTTKNPLHYLSLTCHSARVRSGQNQRVFYEESLRNMATEVYLQALLGLPYVPTAAAVSPPLGRLPLKPLKKMKLVLTATSPRLGFLANECYPLRRGDSHWAAAPAALNINKARRNTKNTTYQAVTALPVRAAAAQKMRANHLRTRVATQLASKILMAFFAPPLKWPPQTLPARAGRCEGHAILSWIGGANTTNPAFCRGGPLRGVAITVEEDTT